MYTFIINANSRSGLGKEIWEKIEKKLQALEVPYQVFFTLPHHRTKVLIQELTSDNLEHTLVIVGGDGTVNEVISGISYPEKITLGYIPTGSGNDFARGLRFPADPMQALDLILSHRNIRGMDIGELSYQKKNRRFIVSSGFGFDAAVCHEVVISHWKSKLNRLKLGKLVYVIVALRQWFHLKPKEVIITLDGTTTHTFQKCYFIASMNLPYEGGGFMFAPNADPSDGKLNICVIANLSKWKMLLLLPTAILGKHVRFKGVYSYTCDQIHIHSQKPRALHTDGEPLYLQRDITLRCLPKQIRIITPP